MDFFKSWRTNKAHSGLSSPKIWRCVSKFKGVINEFIAKNGSKTFSHAYSINHKWYGHEIFSENTLLLKMDRFEGFLHL